MLTLVTQGGDPIFAAAENGDVDKVLESLSEDASVDPRDDDDRTPLMVAAANGHLDVVRVLCDAGADVNAVTGEGVNVLAFAVGKDVREHLIAKGAESAWDSEPKLLHNPGPPDYPKRAKKERVSGEVVLRIKVRTDGTTEVLDVIQSLRYCDEAAIENAVQWRWTPAEKDGQPVAAFGIITVAFNLFAAPK